MTNSIGLGAAKRQIVAVITAGFCFLPGGLSASANAQSNQEYYAEKGVGCLEQGWHNQALVCFNEAVRLNPNSAESYGNRARVHFELGHYQKAIDDYSKAIRLNPSVAEFYANRGAAYASVTRYALAVGDFNEAILLNHAAPLPDLNCDRGQALALLQEWDLAIRDFTTAITLNPKMGQAYFMRGLIYAQLPAERDQAKIDLRKAIALKPQLAQVYRSLSQSQKAKSNPVVGQSTIHLSTNQ